MAKPISITVSDYIYNAFLQNHHNRSAYIESCILKSHDLETSQWETTKSNLQQAVLEIRNKDEEIKKLKAQIGRMRQTQQQETLKLRKEIEKLKDAADKESFTL